MSEAANGATTSYHIDGFRSLRGFELVLQPGLNVLVGPNGSGKTNFLDFLGFLDAAVRSNATNAVSDAGGLARVFSQENTSRRKAHLATKVCGLADLSDAMHNPGQYPYFYYEYELHIRFSRDQSAVFIDKEILKLNKLHAGNNDGSGEVFVGSISISRRSASDTERPAFKIGPRLLYESPRNPLSAIDNAFAPHAGKVRDRLGAFNLGPDQSLLTYGSRYSLPAIEAVRTAITRGRSFNIQPDKARIPDDLTRTPGIMRDGTGLTSTLHALQSLRKAGGKRHIRLRGATTSTLSEIIEWTKLVFSDLEDITVSQDPHTGKYLATLVIGGSFTDVGSLRLALQSSSDGTLKWLALVTLLLSSGGVYSIEEPENFLHPKMQQFLVQLIRDNIVEKPRQNYFLFSTHSETLINFCRPEELVIFEYFDHSTCCYRVDNPSEVLEEINRTGFGLGYYYASNALPQSPRLRGGNDGEDLC